MKVKLEAEAGKFYQIYVNGNLVLEGMGETVRHERELEERLSESQCAVTAIRALKRFIETDWAKEKDHVNKDKDRLRKAAEGLIDGMNNVTQRFECYATTVPDAPGRGGDHIGGPSYLAGYDLGRWVNRCMVMVKGMKGYGHLR